MANTQPFNTPLGLTSLSSFITVNSISLTAPGLVANSSGINVAAATIDNVSSNVFTTNIGNYLSLIANLISMNVLSGNNQTLLSLTSNEVFVNTISGNTITGFLNFTSNEIFVNTISGNNISVPSLPLSSLSGNSITVGGNATAQTILGPNGVYVIDTLGGPDRFMAGEVVLQKGTAATINNFLINFATEVNSGLYKSMRVVLANVVITDTDTYISMKWSTDGTSGALVSSAYHGSAIKTDGFLHDGGGGLDDDLQAAFATNETSARVARYDGNSSMTAWVDIYFYDTTLTAGRRTYGAYSLTGVDWSSANVHDIPMIVLAGGYNNSSSMVIKGAEFRTTTGNFTSVSWTLIGRRHI